MTAIGKNIGISRTELLDGCSDAVSLLALASQEINVRRKELWRPELEESYKLLCTHNKPVTNWLFGDNLSQKVKEMSDTKKMYLRIDSRKISNRKSPFARFQPFNSKPLLGRCFKKQHKNWWLSQSTRLFPYKKNNSTTRTRTHK